MQRAKATLTETTQLERTLWEVQNGRFKNLTDNQQQALLNAARSVDQRQAQLEAERKAAETLEEEDRILKAYNQTLDDAVTRWQELLNPMNAAGKQLSELDQLLDTGRISWDTYSDAIFHVMDGLDEPVAKAKEGTDQMSQFSIQAAREMEGAFADFLFNPFDDGLKGMLQGFVDTLRRMASEALSAELMDKLFGTGRGQTGGSGSTGDKGWIADIIQIAAGFLHEGGIAGAPGSKTRQVPALAFAGTIAPRFHNGGIAESMGIKPNEIPAILEKGEGVFTKEQMAVLGGGGMRQTAPQNISLVVVDERKSVEDVLAGSVGENIHMLHVQRNAQAIKRLLT